MPSVEESSQNIGTQLASILENATETISSNQEVTFTLYVKLILPSDGYVFWVNSLLLTTAALSNETLMKRIGLNNNAIALLKKQLTISGSLHRQVTAKQEDISNLSLNHVIFTALSEVDEFNNVDPQLMWIGEINGAPYSFSRLDSRYYQAGLFHYRGDSIHPVLRAQMITSLDGFNLDQLIVSNSLPILMSLNKHLTVYPAQLVSPNLSPPYAVVDVRDTKPLQAAAHFYGDRSQHVQDTVRVTLTGLNNDAALRYVDYVIQEALDDEQFGIINSPVVIDDKMNQNEINALAMRKHIDFDINYYQKTATSIAKQLITSVFIDIEES